MYSVGHITARYDEHDEEEERGMYDGKDHAGGDLE